MPTQEEIALFESVKQYGLCHENLLKWVLFDDGTGSVATTPKRRSTCPTCFRDYVITREVVDLDDY